MAEFRDWTNRIVLYIDVKEHKLEHSIGDIKVVFQKKVFIDNKIGWLNEVEAEVNFYDFYFSRANINEFVNSANNWLKLPIDKLGSTYFFGDWNLGIGNKNILTLGFDKYYSTPSKTDWFTVTIDIKSVPLDWSINIHTDYSCLALFVDGLSF